MKKLIPVLIFLISSCTFLYSQNENTNKLPVVNLEIASVSGEAFVAPVWLKFYPGGTYDPDGKIVKFEMDYNSDGIYEVSDSIMQGGTFEYTEPGEYSATVRVTDDKGGITTLTKTFIISTPNSESVETREENLDKVKQNKKITNDADVSYEYKPISNDKKSDNQSTISETWSITQHNGFKGTLDIQLLPSEQFSGTISWDRHESGTVNGQIYGSTIEFTVIYSKSKNANYKGTLIQNNTKIIDGTVKSNDGTRSTWEATKVITNKKQFNSNNVSNNKPLTTSRMYHPDSIVKSGRWGNAVNIREDKYFDKFKTEYMEPGIKWTNGMYTPPDYKPTEMIYYHDQSKIYLTGFVSILDCIDYCGSAGDCGFSIIGDGNVLWKSGIVRHQDKPVEFNVSLKGINELRLIVNYGGDDLGEDWAAWLELKVNKKNKKNKTEIVKDKNIIINGSFEEGFAPGTFKTFKEGDKFPGWTVSKATVDLSGPYLNPADGKNCIDLNGTPGFGGIQQRFFTEKGKKYVLSFYLAGNPAGGPTIKRLLVSFGDQKSQLQFDITGKTTRNMGWEYKELVFKAKERATILKFESDQLTGPDSWGPVIDNVKLVLYDKKKSKRKSKKKTETKSEVKVVTNEDEAPLFEFNYGIVGGASYYFINDNDISRLTNYNASSYNLKVEDKVLGFHLGLITQMRIWRILLRPEFVFNYNTINYQVSDLNNSSNDKSAKENLLFFDVPVLFGYKHNNFRIMAGPVGRLFITNKSELNDIINNSKDFENFTLGYQAGVGFDVSNFGMDLRFEGNMRKLGDGIILSGNKVYFSETPNNIRFSFTYYIK